MYSSAVFAGSSTTLQPNFTWTGSSPSTILGIRKLDTGLPDGEDRIRLRSLVLTQYWSVTDGQTHWQFVLLTDNNKVQHLIL